MLVQWVSLSANFILCCFWPTSLYYSIQSNYEEIRIHFWNWQVNGLRNLQNTDSKMRLSAVRLLKDTPGLLGLGVKKWAYNFSRFNQYGLRYDDCLYENEDVTEAIRRLPLPLQDERIYRLTRAVQLSLQKTILPKDQWTKFEEDKRYLLPYLEEVIKEREEREAWFTK